MCGIQDKTCNCEVPSQWCLISGLTILIWLPHRYTWISIELKCVLEPLHSPVSRELCVQRRATHMTTLNDRRKVLAAPLMVAGWAEILAIFLVQVESTVIYFVCLRQRPIKIKQERQRPNELFRWPRARWSYWTKFEVEQRAQTCIFHVPALDDSIHPFASKCCYYRLTKLIQHDSFACRPNCIWKVFAWVWFVWTLLNERLKCWWPSLADWEWDVVWRVKDGEYWNCTCWNYEQCWTRYNLKFELNWSLTNAPGPDEIVLDKIKSMWFNHQDWREKAWPCRSKYLIQRFDWLEELLLLQD